MVVSQSKMAISSIPRDKGAPRPVVLEAPPRAASFGTKAEALESRVPGYTGFQAGGQHIFGDTYGRMTGSLRSAHRESPGNKNMFLNYEERKVRHVGILNAA
eukprot:SAG11_NODE_7248_length_1173_cov_1.286778_1_plen_101_part_10